MLLMTLTDRMQGLLWDCWCKGSAMKLWEMPMHKPTTVSTWMQSAAQGLQGMLKPADSLSGLLPACAACLGPAQGSCWGTPTLPLSAGGAKGRHKADKSRNACSAVHYSGSDAMAQHCRTQVLGGNDTASRRSSPGLRYVTWHVISRYCSFSVKALQTHCPAAKHTNNPAVNGALAMLACPQICKRLA